MNNCQCGVEIKGPTFWIVPTNLSLPLAIFQCTCGIQTQLPYTTMKPYTAKRTPTFPPNRGDYSVTPDKVILFKCPVCEALSPIRAPTHSVNPDTGLVTPSVTCPTGCGFHSHVTLEGDFNG